MIIIKYDSYKFILTYQDSDFLSLLVEVTKEVQQLYARYMRLKRNEFEDGQTYYRDHLGDSI